MNLTQQLINCAICDELIGENERTISISYCFGDHMPVMEKMLVHLRCCDEVDIVDHLMHTFEVEY